MHTLRVSEATHTLFYTPFYVAIEKGYFKKAGLKLKLENERDSDKVMGALLKHSAEIGLMSPETPLHLYNKYMCRSVVCFAKLNQVRPIDYKDTCHIPSTVFCAHEDYIRTHEKLFRTFTHALQRAMKDVAKYSPRKLAFIISPQFPETQLSVAEKIISHYKRQAVWSEDLLFKKESYDLLGSILKDTGRLTAMPPYQSVVNTCFAERALTSGRKLFLKW